MSDQTNIVGPHSAWEPKTSINIRRSMWERLQKYHKFGSTFDSVITELLDSKEKLKQND